MKETWLKTIVKQSELSVKSSVLQFIFMKQNYNTYTHMQEDRDKDRGSETEKERQSGREMQKVKETNRDRVRKLAQILCRKRNSIILAKINLFAP